MIIGLDVDGVFASFEHGYAPILTKYSGIEFPLVGKEGWPTTWYWERDAGVTPEQEAEAWKEIKSSKNFWSSLPTLKGADEFLRKLNKTNHDVYFITDRPGFKSKYQTALWLSMHFQYHQPTVIVSRNKGAVCAAIGVEVYIDDRPKNITDVMDKSPSTDTYLIRRPYNTQLYDYDKAVDTLEEFAERAGLWEKE